jgi:pimeloyl-ACP methyl ester carboxylesterase
MVRRGFVRVGDGEIHYAEEGAGPPVLLLHQTPRSWDEYRDVLPILGERYRAIAMDTIGFGDSSRAPWPGSIERYASVAAQFLQALEIERAAVVGHHTGGAIAFELAASRPELVEALVLSSTPFVDAEFRRARAELGRPVVDGVDTAEDGSHLVALWQGRAAFYPPGRPDLLERFVRDALKAGLPATHEGHLAVAAYAMEDKLDAIRVPVLLIGATDDPYAFPHLRPLAEALPGSTVVELEGGMVPLPDQLAREFAAAVVEFLDAVRMPP